MQECHHNYIDDILVRHPSLTFSNMLLDVSGSVTCLHTHVRMSYSSECQQAVLFMSGHELHRGLPHDHHQRWREVLLAHGRVVGQNAPRYRFFFYPQALFGPGVVRCTHLTHLQQRFAHVPLYEGKKDQIMSLLDPLSFKCVLRHFIML